MQDPRTRKLVRGVVAGIAAALVAVPVAQAKLTVDARHQALLDKAKVGQVAPERKIAQMHRHLAHLQLPAGESNASDSGGFDWSDAGIGASAGFALVLLAGGSVLVTRRKLVGV
jgi:hypothetical protein